MASARRSARTTGGRVRSSPSSCSRASSSTRRSARSKGTSTRWGPYLSPLASPYFETKGLGIPLVTPAILILPFPGLFRFTCYYYRKAYYRSFAMTPPACAVGAARPGRVQRRAQAAHLPEPAPVRALLRAPVPRVPLARLHQVAVVRGPRASRRRVARDPCKLHVPHALHALLPLVPPPRRRQREQLLRGAARHAPPQDLERRLEAERQPHGLRLGQPLRRRALRLLHPVASRRARSPTSGSSECCSERPEHAWRTRSTRPIRTTCS